MTPEFFPLLTKLLGWMAWPCLLMCMYIIWECIKRTRWGFGQDIARSWGIRYYLVCLLATILSICFLLRLHDWVYVGVSVLLFDYIRASAGVWQQSVPMIAKPPKAARRVFTTGVHHHG
jgi:hypothetical protein